MAPVGRPAGRPVGSLRCPASHQSSTASTISNRSPPNCRSPPMRTSTKAPKVGVRWLRWSPLEEPPFPLLRIEVRTIPGQRHDLQPGRSFGQRLPRDCAGVARSIVDDEDHVVAPSGASTTTLNSSTIVPSRAISRAVYFPAAGVVKPISVVASASIGVPATSDSISSV